MKNLPINGIKIDAIACKNRNRNTYKALIPGLQCRVPNHVSPGNDLVHIQNQSDDWRPCNPYNKKERLPLLPWFLTNRHELPAWLDQRSLTVSREKRSRVTIKATDETCCANREMYGGTKQE